MTSRRRSYPCAGIGWLRHACHGAPVFATTCLLPLAAHCCCRLLSRAAGGCSYQLATAAGCATTIQPPLRRAVSHSPTSSPPGAPDAAQLRWAEGKLRPASEIQSSEQTRPRAKARDRPGGAGDEPSLSSPRLLAAQLAAPPPPLRRRAISCLARRDGAAPCRRRRRRLLPLLLLLLAAPAALAQSVALLSGSASALTFVSGSRVVLSRETGPPTGAYSTYASKLTLGGPGADATAPGSSGSPGASASLPAPSASSPSASASPPVNRQPCNNYVELCTRKYSNITHVAAHNSPFVRPGNSGSNQELPVKTQLDDGIRLVQAQVHWPANATEPHVCHTSCDLLDAGPLAAWLTQVREWVDGHPYDVVTVLLGNSNYSAADLYAPYIQQSGLVRYAYEAPFLPMALVDWPTLEELILPAKRVLLFLDYMADQRKHPWLLDQFAHMWESPFDPQDRTFPCFVQRPPDLKADQARDRLMLMNHNLNVQFDVFGAQLLVPAVALLNDTNAADGFGSLGATADRCRADWGCAPNFLNVDYYNYGRPPGSVFAVAARANNLPYNRPCCGQRSVAAAALVPRLLLALLPTLVCAL